MIYYRDNSKVNTRTVSAYKRIETKGRKKGIVLKATSITSEMGKGWPYYKDMIKPI